MAISRFVILSVSQLVKILSVSQYCRLVIEKKHFIFLNVFDN